MLKIVLSMGLALAVLLGAARARLVAAQGKPPSENTQAVWQWSNQLPRNHNQTPAGQPIQSQEQAKTEATVGTQLMDGDRTQNDRLTKTQARQQIQAQVTVTPAAPAKGFLDRDRIRRQEQLCTRVQDGLQQQDRLHQSNPTGADRNRPHSEAPSCGQGHDN